MSAGAPGSLGGKGQSKAPKFQQLGKYRLVSRLGQGGMGVVYKALDTVGRTVALKILSPHLASNQMYVGRFLREARSAAALSHPNIVGALDVGQEGNYYYFAMEFVDGVTVKSRLKAEGRFSEVEAVTIVLQVARALQHAAGKSIVHRDIKPENIMISKDGVVKLTDMGLAKATDSTEATITQAGSMIGTPQYASPEQIRGEATIDPRTDVYSLGMTLFHMVVGKVAFDGGTTAVVNAKHLNEPLPDVKAARPDLSDGLCRVIQNMCEKEAAKRYQSPDQLIEDLELVGSGQAPKHAGTAILVPLPGRPAAARPARRLAGIGAGAIAGIVGAVVIGVAAIVFMAGKAPPSTAANATAGGSAPVAALPAAGEVGGPLGDGLAQDVKTALERAKKLAEADPDDLGAIVALYSIVLKFPGTSEAKAAQVEIDKLNAEVQAALGQKEREVQGHMGGSAYADALTAISAFPEKYRFGAWAEKHAALKDSCEESIGTAFKKLEEGATKAVEAGDFPVARQFYKNALAQFPPAYARTIEKALEDVEAKEEDYQQRVAVLRRRLHKAFLTRIENAQRTRDYAGVRKAAETAAADPAQAALKTALQMEAEHAKLLVRMLELAEQGAAKRKGKTCRFEKLGQKGMALKDVQNGQLVFAGEGGLAISLSIAKQLKTAEMMDLVRAELEPEEQRNVLLGAFYFAEGDLKSARQYWETAAKDGKDVSLALEKLEMVSLGEKELEAQAALAKVRSCFGRKRWEEAVKLIGTAQTTYKETQTVSKAAGELAEMLRKSKENLAAAATAEAEKEDEKETPAGPSGPPSRKGDGLEQYTDWTVMSFYSTTGSGTISFGGLKGDSDPNRVMRFTYHNVSRRIYIGRTTIHDFSRAKYLAVRVQNRSDKVWISLGMYTGPQFTYYLGQAQEFGQEKTTYNRFKLTSSLYDCCQNEIWSVGKVRDLDDVRQFFFVVCPKDPQGELVFEHIGLED